MREITCSCSTRLCAILCNICVRLTCTFAKYIEISLINSRNFYMYFAYNMQDFQLNFTPLSENLAKYSRNNVQKIEQIFNENCTFI